MTGKMAIDAAAGGGKLFTVGDQSTLTFIEENIIPDVFIVDYQIKREPSPGLKARFNGVSDVTMKVRNPPGAITRELWSTIYRALPSEEKVRIEVDGEEDLATLPCISLAEKGSLVAYGLPDQGLVVVDVDDASRNRVRKILEKMRENNAS